MWQALPTTLALAVAAVRYASHGSVLAAWWPPA